MISPYGLLWAPLLITSLAAAFSKSYENLCYYVSGKTNIGCLASGYKILYNGFNTRSTNDKNITFFFFAFFRSFLLELKERVLSGAVDENIDQQGAVISLLGALGGLRSPMSCLDSLLGG